MNPSSEVLFSSDLWEKAIEKFAGAAHMTVKLYDDKLRAVSGPIHPSPLFQLFDDRGYDPGIFVECARRCIVQTKERPAVIVAQFHGLAVVGTSLLLDGNIVGAAVGGYVLADFSQVSEIQSLARQAGIAFEPLWEVARQQQPVPQNRLIVHGELLQVLGDALLRENYRTRQYAEAAAIVASSDDAIISKDLDGIITTWNRGAERIFGYTASEAVGQSIMMLIPVDHLEDETMILDRIRRGETVYHYETVRQRKDGTLVDTSLTVSPMKDAQGRVVGASKIARDITERKRAENALRVSEAQLQAELADTQLLHSISAQLIQEEGVESLYEKVLDAAVSIMRSDFASLQMLFPERGTGGELRLLAFRGFSPQAAAFWEWVGFDSKGSSCGAALRSGKRVIVADAEKCDFMKGTEDMATYLQTGIRAVQTTPLLSRSGKIVGMISTHWSNPHEPSERDLRVFDILVRQAADLIERKTAQEALQHAHDALESVVEKRTASLKRLSSRLQHVQDDERRRISRELHDSAGQYLAAIKMNLAQIDPGELPKSRAAALAESEQLLDTCLAEIRTISHLLHPPLLDESGLSSAARWYVEGFEKRSGVKVNLSISSVEKRLPQPVEMALFRALQESLTNVHRHSESLKVDIRIDVDNGEAVLDVRDYGKGVSADQLAGFEKGIDLGVGLVGMRERVSELGGKFQIISAKPGISVIVTIPTKAKQAGFISSGGPSEEHGSAA